MGGDSGGSAFAGFLGRSIIQFRVRASLAAVGEPVDYAISVSVKDGSVHSEGLSVGDRTVFSYPQWPAGMDRFRPALGRFKLFEALDELKIDMLRKQFVDAQFLDPAAAVQREYSVASAASRMGDHGENFAALIKTILKDDRAASAYLAWLKELTPAELDEVVVLPGAKRDWLFALRKNGVDYPADVLSDGTLRFAAIAAAFFQPMLPRTLILEEIENGLHPTRLRLLVELLKSQAGNGISQVMATSHSPLAIAWLREEDYRTVFLCSKDDENGASSITPFSSIPRLIELARTQSVADLFAEGWLESAI